MKNIITIVILFFTYAFSANNDPVYSDKGMVVSTSLQASEAGIEILKNDRKYLVRRIKLCLLGDE